jgi:moderate conductance mechanosensitive channel
MVNLNFFNQISPETLNLIIQKLAKISGIAAAALIAQKISYFSINKLTKKDKPRLKTLVTLFKESAKILIDFIALLLILTELGFNILPLITSAGIFGLAVGMGAKNVASDLIAGIFIILENRFNIGEIIEINSKYKGKVTKIDLRTITLETEKGDLHILPNSTITSLTKIK